MEHDTKLFDHEKYALESCDKAGCRMLWHKSMLATKLWPMLVVVGSSEVAVGIILLIVILVNSQELDKIYSTEYNNAISVSTYGVLILLTITGLMLLISLMLERRRLMLVRNFFFMLMYILLSTILCTYIFALSAFEIHSGILRLRSDAFKSVGRIRLLNTPCVLGILTMFGSVVHLIGKLVVITYYYFKFIQPRMNTYELNCDI